MIGSKQVKNEKIAGNNYSAKLNIIFAKDFVEYILAQKELKKQGEKFQESFIIIAAQKSGYKISLWEENNQWQKALKRS